jgi:predicted GNAT family acetyltransferase
MYNEVGGGLLITETIVPVPLEGRGVASRLAKHVLADIRARGILILPTCPFFAGYLQKHPEHADIVHPSYRIALGL